MGNRCSNSPVVKSEAMIKPEKGKIDPKFIQESFRINNKYGELIFIHNLLDGERYLLRVITANDKFQANSEAIRFNDYLDSHKHNKSFLTLFDYVHETNGNLLLFFEEIASDLNTSYKKAISDHKIISEKAIWKLIASLAKVVNEYYSVGTETVLFVKILLV